MTKKPTIASTPATATDRFGTSISLSLRPVRTKDALMPPATRTATIAKTIHAAGVPMTIAR